MMIDLFQLSQYSLICFRGLVLAILLFSYPFIQPLYVRRQVHILALHMSASCCHFIHLYLLLLGLRLNFFIHCTDFIQYILSAR